MTLQASQVEHDTPLARILWERRITRTAVAREIGVDQSTVARWCDGSRVLPPARVTQLAELLGVEEEELKPGEPKE